MTDWTTEKPQIVKTPTFAQEEYANSLVERMKEESIVSVRTYARKVMQCQNRQEMSRLINEMRHNLKQADAFIADDL